MNYFAVIISSKIIYDGVQKRRSWADDSKQSEGKTYESESGGNDSDASIEDHRVTGEIFFDISPKGLKDD